MAQRKRRLTLIEIIVILSMIFIFLSILGPALQRAAKQRDTQGAAPASQYEERQRRNPYFWQP